MGRSAMKMKILKETNSIKIISINFGTSPPVLLQITLTISINERHRQQCSGEE